MRKNKKNKKIKEQIFKNKSKREQDINEIKMIQ